MSEKSFEEKLRQLDVVFVIDTTGSMQPCIDQVRTKLNYLAKSIAAASIRPNVAYGVVAYRDHPPEDYSYVTRVFPVSADLAKIQSVLNGLVADGGGDEPEAVMDGVWDALHDSRWRAEAYKALVLVGDAPAHTHCPRELTFDKIIKEARARHVPIFAVGASDNDQMADQFTRLASKTNGLYVKLGDIDSLIDQILSLLQKTVIVDMELSLAVFNRRMAGLSAGEIARQIGRTEPEVEAIIRSLEAKGAKWPAVSAATASSDRGVLAPPPTVVKAPTSGSIPITAAAPTGSSPVGRPMLVPISNLGARPSYGVRWMGWQGAQGYELEEAAEPSFAHASIVYSGTDPGWTASGKIAGRYYYRVRMRDAAGMWGEWSDVQSTIVA